jgi:prostatic aicd phosphatase
MSPAKHRSVGAEAARQWNIYDYMNVNNIHNGTFAGSIPKGYMEQARALANWHEYNVFSDPQLAGIGNSER